MASVTPERDTAGAGAVPISVGSKLRSPLAVAFTRYRECLKNHAASIGGNITDGCGEFMPSGEDGTLEALKCAACNCHRNFHRKESISDDADFVGRSSNRVHPLQLPPPPLLTSPSVNHHHLHCTVSMGTGTMHNNWGAPVVSPVKMSFGGGSGAATDSSSEELNFNAYQSPNATVAQPFGMSKKRFRTKFTQEQKEKMMDFADRVGWRIPREDDAEVQRFCCELGVKRQVLKVWMHNNKNSSTSARKQPQPPQQQTQEGAYGYGES